MSGVLTTGVDEAGRGPLAGPVVAAAVILDPARPVAGLADSKALTPAVRRELAAALRCRALAWSIGLASPAEIDALNILQATLLAMRRAVAGLALAPGHVEIDGNRLPRLEGLPGIVSAEAVVRGTPAERPSAPPPSSPRRSAIRLWNIWICDFLHMVSRSIRATPPPHISRRCGRTVPQLCTA